MQWQVIVLACGIKSSINPARLIRDLFLHYRECRIIKEDPVIL